jgi:hypothetical protein
VERLLAAQGTFLLYVFFSQRPGGGGPGITEDTLAALEGAMRLVSRVDGTERGSRPSAWLTFKKP